MIVGVITVSAVGLLCTVIGCLIWRKEMISLLHDYHYENVSEENKKAFCKLSGIGVLSVGIGLLISAVILALTDSALSFIAAAVGLAIGMALLINAGAKYNKKH